MLSLSVSLWWLGHWTRSTKTQNQSIPSPALVKEDNLTQVTPAPTNPLPPKALPQLPTVELSEPIKKFGEWTQHYLAAGSQDKAKLLPEGKQLAQMRRPAFLDLIKLDPRQALEKAVPMVIRQQLPADIVGLLEERVAGKGTVRLYQSTPIPGDTKPQAPITRVAELQSGKTYAAYVYGRRARSVLSTVNTSLNGVALEGQFAINESPLRVLEVGEIPDTSKPKVEICPVSGLTTTPDVAAGTAVGAETPVVEAEGRIVYLCNGSHTIVYEGTLISAEGGTGGGQSFTGILPAAPSPSLGVLKVLYIPMTFADQNTVPASESTCYEVMKRVSDFYTKASYGRLTCVTTVTPPVKLPHNAAWYIQKDTTDGVTKEIDGLGLEHSHARDEARKMGYDSNDYNCIVVRLNGGPRATGGWGGGSSVWVYGDWDNVCAHEIGHCFGLAHANFWNTGGASSIGAGANEEYGDSYDVMGGGSFPSNQYNAQARNQIKWLPSSFVQTVTTSGQYRITAFDLGTLDPTRRYAMKIAKDSQRTYWGEVRTLFDGSNNWATNGMILGWNWPTNSGSNIQLIDTTPGSPGAKNDAPIYVGRTFSDYEAGIHITTVAVNQNPRSMDVVVNFGNNPNNHPPTLALTSTAQVVPLNTQITFTATASDPDGDTLAYSWLSSDNTSASTAIIGANAPSLTRSFATAGFYVVTCVASDMKGGTSTQNLLITAGNPGAKYNISGRITTNGTGLQGVYVSTAGSTNATLTDSKGYYTIPNLAAGTYTVVPQLYGYTFAEQFNNSLTLAPSALNADFTADTAGTLSIVASVPNTKEGSATPGKFTLTRVGANNADLIVKYVSLTGTASTTDYTLTAKTPDGLIAETVTTGSPYNSITIPASYDSLDIIITPTTDALVEGPETVTMQLGLDPAYVISGTAYATITIDDNNTALPKVGVTASSIPAYEGPTPQSTYLTFTRTGSTAGALTVNYTITGTATNGTDYTSLPGSVTIPIGAVSTTVSVAPIDDSISEGNETVILTITANAAYVIDSTATSGTVTLVDDDEQIVSLAVTDAIATEVDLTQPGAVPDPATFVVTRSGDINQPLTVYYGVSGTATPNVDFEPLSGLVTFAANQSTSTITITPRFDTLGEGDETVYLQLASGGTNYTMGAVSSGTVTIKDASDAPYVDVIPLTNATENSTVGKFRFTLHGSKTGNVTVNYTVGGNAVAGTDYTALSGSVSIAGTGSSSSNYVDVSVTSINNSIANVLRNVSVSITPSANYQTFSPTSTASIWLYDDDQPTVFVDAHSTSNPPSLSENAVAGKFYLSRTGSTTNALTVNYSMTGTAQNGIDYTTLSGVATIPAGGLGVDVPFTTINDAVFKGTRTMTLHLESGSYSSGADATFLIMDDETSNLKVGFTSAGSHGSESVTTVNVPVNLNAASATPVTVEYLTDSGSKSSVAGTIVPYWVRSVRAGNSFSSFISSDGVTWNQIGATQTIAMSSASYLAGLDVTSHANGTLSTAVFDNVSVTNLDAGATLGAMTTADVGSVSAAGSYTTLGSTYFVKGSGADIYGTADAFRYVYYPITNSLNCTITARVLSQTNTNASAKAGVMFRESTAASSINTTTVATPTSGAYLQWRPTTSAATSTTGLPTSGVFPMWLKLERVGDSFTSWYSTNGTAWTIAGTVNLPLGTNALAGLAVCSHVDGTLATGVFDNVSITPSAGGVLESQDIGFLSAPGSASVSSGTYTLQGSGSDIFGTADAFQFMRMPIQGDCVLIARAVSLTNTNSSAKIGLMIRENSSGWARHVYFGAKPGSGLEMINRSTTAATAQGTIVDDVVTGGTLTFAPGETAKTIPVTITNDKLLERPETIVLTLRNANGAGLDVFSQYTYTIENDDTGPTLPSVGFAATTATGTEDITAPSIIVSLSATSASTVTVDYAVTGGTATSNTDYTLPSGTLSFAPGELVKTIPLTVIDDTTPEPSETVIITFSNPVGSVVSSSNTHTNTITDNDLPTVTIVATDAIATEGNASDTGTFTISRTGDTTNALTVNFITSGTATSGADYTALGTSLTIPAGSSSATLTVATINDSTVEANETVIVTLSANAAYVIGSPNAATVTIMDDDTNIVNIVATTPNASETGPTAGKFTVTRTGNYTGAITVNLTIGGTATNTTDYATLASTVTIPANQTSAVLTITPVNDSLIEGAEQVVVSISTGTNYVAGAQNFATVIIADNDVAPTLFISNPTTKAVQLPSNTGLQLGVTASDDGLPSPLIITWSQFSGPGTAVFSDIHSATPTVTFPVNGIYILHASAYDGLFTTGDDLTVQVGGFAAGNWIDVSLNTPTVRGMAGENASSIHLLGSGAGYSGTADQAHLFCRQVSGDCSITARVVSLSNAATTALAGVMLRDTTYRSAIRVFAGVKTSGVVEKHARTTVAGTDVSTVGTTKTAPLWLKIDRVYNATNSNYDITTSQAPDVSGAPGTWTAIGTTTSVVMGTNCILGLSASNGSNGTTCDAIFDNVAITPVQTGVATIVEGLSTTTGYTYSESAGTFTVTTTGSLGDSGLYRWQQFVGDVTTTARIMSHTAGGFDAKGGVMIRDFSTDSTSYGVMGIATYWGGYFNWRNTIGGSASTNYGGSNANPQWIRMVRSGSGMMAYKASNVSSAPGAWSQQGVTQTFASVAQVYAGIAIDSSGYALGNTVVMDNLTVTPNNTAPSVSIGSASNVIMPANASLNGVVSDDNKPAGAPSLSWTKQSGPGNVTFANASVAATTATFDTAGTYVLRLMADDGEVQTFNDVSVTVYATPFAAWQAQQFISGSSNPAASEANDADFDGLSNLMEYALLTNPNSSNVNPCVTDAESVSNQKYLRLTVPKNPAATDVTYTVEATSNLANVSSWSSSGLVVEVNNSTTLRVRDNVAVAPGVQRFLRVKVTRP